MTEWFDGPELDHDVCVYSGRPPVGCSLFQCELLWAEIYSSSLSLTLTWDGEGGGGGSPCSTKEGKDANGVHQPYRRAAGDFLWLQSDPIDDLPNRDLMVNPWMTHAEIVWKHKGDIFLQTLGCLFPSPDQRLQWLIL